ncbi:MAG: hypothetical protein WCP85_31670 [Mariniphaga sp.]
MKKFMFMLFVCAIFNSTHYAYTQTSKPYPIPSYNVNINGIANFQETNSSSYPDGKRQLQAESSCFKSLSSCVINMYVYSLDGLDCLGPYFLSCEQTLSVEIDDRAWGVVVQSECDVQVSVWIDGVVLTGDVSSGSK